MEDLSLKIAQTQEEVGKIVLAMHGLSARLTLIENWMPEAEKIMKQVLRHLRGESETSRDENLTLEQVGSATRQEEATTRSTDFLLRMLIALAVGGALSYCSYLIARGGMP